MTTDDLTRSDGDRIRWSSEVVADWARRLDDAVSGDHQLEPPGPPDLATGYAVQDAGRALHIARGGLLAGYKVGVTAVAGQQKMGLSGPLRGYLLDDMLARPQVGIDSQPLHAPVLEAEIAFVMGETPPTGPHSREDVLACVSHLQIALEVADTRWNPNPGSASLLTADNVMCAGVVVGVSQPTDTLDLREAAVRVQIGAQTVTGDASAVMGDPVLSLDWLAGELAAAGEPLQAGAFVMSGTLCPATPFRSGDDVTADFGPLGTLSTRVH